MEDEGAITVVSDAKALGTDIAEKQRAADETRTQIEEARRSAPQLRRSHAWDLVVKLESKSFPGSNKHVHQPGPLAASMQNGDKHPAVELRDPCCEQAVLDALGRDCQLTCMCVQGIQTLW